MLFDSRFCNFKNQKDIQQRFAELYRVLDESMELNFFKKGETGENEFLRTFYVMIKIGNDPEAMWTSIEDIYEKYFKKELMDKPEGKISFWLRELNNVNQSITNLNHHLLNNIADNLYYIVIISMPIEINGFSIRSKALLLQFHCYFSAPPEWNDKLLRISCLEEETANLIDAKITDIEHKYSPDWQNSELNDLFSSKIVMLRNKLINLKNAQKEISILDLVKWVELAVWAGEPKGTFSNRWNFVFNRKNCKTHRDAVDIFWNDLVRTYRNNYLKNLLELQFPRCGGFVLKEAERLRYNNNLHNVSRNEINLEHIIPQNPKFPIRDLGISENEFRDNYLNSLANLIFLDQELNKPGSIDQPPHIKAAYYKDQLGRDGDKVKHVMGEVAKLGNDFDMIFKKSGRKSPLYLACLFLRQIDLALFVAEML